MSHHSILIALLSTGGYTGGYTSGRVFSLQGGRWTELPAMSTPREGPTCVHMDQEIWAIGGDTDTVEILNLVTKKWRDGPRLPTSVYRGQAVVYEDQLFVIDRDGPVYRYSDNLWQKVADIQSYEYRPLFPAPVVNRQILKC